MIEISKNSAEIAYNECDLMLELAGKFVV